MNEKYCGNCPKREECLIGLKMPKGWYSDFVKEHLKRNPAVDSDDVTRDHNRYGLVKAAWQGYTNAGISNKELDSVVHALDSAGREETEAYTERIESTATDEDKKLMMQRAIDALIARVDSRDVILRSRAENMPGPHDH